MFLSLLAEGNSATADALATDGYALISSDSTNRFYELAGHDVGDPAEGLETPVISSASSPDGKGLVLATVGAATTKTGHGFWLVASDGGMFTFDSLPFYGNAGSEKINNVVSGAWYSN